MPFPDFQTKKAADANESIAFSDHLAQLLTKEPWLLSA